MMHSTSTSSLHYFDSIKWKKRLHKISHKLHRSHNNNHWNVKSSQSATVLAAATEKYARTESTKIAIHSEDLTASQFANLTGIKTKRNSSHSIYSREYIDSDSEDDSEDEYYSTTTTSTNYNTTSMRIWDSHFWQDGRKSLPTITTTPLTKSASLNQVSTAATTTTAAAAITPITNNLTSQPLVRNRSEPAKSSCVQKGRFKIVWGQDDNTEIKPIQCVEWKRKRASSNPIQQQ